MFWCSWKCRVVGYWSGSLQHIGFINYRQKETFCSSVLRVETPKTEKEAKRSASSQSHLLCNCNSKLTFALPGNKNAANIISCNDIPIRHYNASFYFGTTKRGQSNLHRKIYYFNESSPVEVTLYRLWYFNNFLYVINISWCTRKAERILSNSARQVECSAEFVWFANEVEDSWRSQCLYRFLFSTSHIGVVAFEPFLAFYRKHQNLIAFQPLRWLGIGPRECATSSVQSGGLVAWRGIDDTHRRHVAGRSKHLAEYPTFAMRIDGNNAALAA